jgi:recombination protein RecT
MPSGISGEAYVLPYNIAGKMTAQFQLGYQGLITLFYRSGVQAIRAEIVRKNDVFTYENGNIRHEIDILKSNEERGEVVGAYAIALLNGQTIGKAMNIKDILKYRDFSKSKNSQFSPWNEKNDPESWMYKKTVLKQLGKLVPKNETIFKAISLDNQDSIISDRLEKAKEQSKSLQMGEVLENKYEKTNENQTGEDAVIDAESNEVISPWSEKA